MLLSNPKLLLSHDFWKETRYHTQPPHMQPEMYVAEQVLGTDYSVVSGTIPSRVIAIQRLLESKARDDNGLLITFDSLVSCNIGCPQSMGQPFITFPREVMALLDAPFLLEHPKVAELFHREAIQRARRYLRSMGGPTKTGAYTPPQGFAFVRKIVADHITQRDRARGADLPAQSWEDVMLTDGASVGVRQVMQLCTGGKQDGVACPVPAYPLYTAMLTLTSATPLFYYLEEDQDGNWGLSPQCIFKALQGCPDGVTPRLLIVPNPGNPTGHVLTVPEMERIIRIAHENNVLLLADEVYQENIYDPSARPFVSFREVCLRMEEPFASQTKLVSLHSVSKGLIAECGRRGGYMACLNVPRPVVSELLKLNSINICPNINGQIMTALMLDPPTPDNEPECAALYAEEMQANFSALCEKASSIAQALNKIPGISCQPIPGAMYLFPAITLPESYLERNEYLNKANNTNVSPDTRWALELLDTYGVVVIPGEGFRQQKSTFHFRTTILPSDVQLERMIASIESFQRGITALK